MTGHRIGTRDGWVAASTELLKREKELTRMGDDLARQRRELPWVPVEKQYMFHPPAVGSGSNRTNTTHASLPKWRAR